LLRLKPPRSLDAHHLDASVEQLLRSAMEYATLYRIFYTKRIDSLEQDTQKSFASEQAQPDIHILDMLTTSRVGQPVALGLCVAIRYIFPTFLLVELSLG